MMSCASMERFNVNLAPKVEIRSFSVPGDQKFADFKNMERNLKSAF
jgi:hypothetical protein